jgi:hypothetical protein
MKRLGTISLGVMLTVVLAFGAFAGVASAKKPGSPDPVPAAATVPVTGTAIDEATGLPDPALGSATGEFAIERFTNSGGQLFAVGTFTGSVTDAVTGKTTEDSQGITMPVTLNGATGAVVAQQASCEILDLVLGPLDLDLLGLVVHLDQVHLNITAEQGPGNLLGNLLCAVAGLLDNTPPAGGLTGLLNSITALLNQILSILN